MSIHPTKHGTYEVKWRERGVQRSESRKTLAGAEALDERVKQRRSQGRAVLATKDIPTLADFGNNWLARRTDLEDSTQAKYAEWLEVHIYPALGHLLLSDLSPRRLAEWQEDRLDDGAGPAVLGKAQGLLARILKKAVLPHEYLDSNPVLALDKPRYRKKEHRWLTAPEVESLRSWFLEADDLGSATLVSVLAYIGIRPQDALALHWTDVGEKLSVVRKNSQGVIKPGSKTGEGYKRKVTVPAPVAADLAEWRASSEGTLVFGRRSDGQPWTKNDWDNWRSRIRPDGRRGYSFKQAAEEVGLGSTLKPYDLRHTAASLYAASGWDHTEIAKQLGHSPEVSVREYQHLIDTSQRGSIEFYIGEAREHAPGKEAIRC